MEYLNCHHTNPAAPTYSCTCSSSIRDTHDMIGELQTSGCPSRAFLLSKSPEGVQTQTDIPEGRDRSCGYRKGLQHGEAGSFLMAQNSVLGGQTISIPLTHAAPLFELPCRHLAYIPPLLKQYRMCAYDIRSPQAVLQSQRTDTKLSNQLQLYFVNNF